MYKIKKTHSERGLQSSMPSYHILPSFSFLTTHFINSFLDFFHEGFEAGVLVFPLLVLFCILFLRLLVLQFTQSLFQFLVVFTKLLQTHITHFIDTMEEFYKAADSDSKLKRIRENRGLTQTELAEQSGIKVRNIRMYEQRVNNIDKAQAHILYKLSRVLGCDIEDLLENPMM